ncbi:type IV secretion system protein [Brachymonas denitrificans]|uniref:type IV secretion system protein n=1 Tax=Brachymonas denitrificans TaxID=28220 RepID=UPI001BCE8BD8|nr:type IV secretion system protein [Brachymonas denitrificans]
MLDGYISAALFEEIRSYIVDLIGQFGYAGLGRMMAFAGAVGTVWLTIWFMVQGYRIATGQSRESLHVFIVRAITVTAIVAVAQGLAIFGQDLASLVLDLRNSIALAITGGEYEDPSKMVGKVLTGMLTLQVAMDLAPVLGPSSGNNLNMANTLSFITGAGQALPALIAGGLMLLNEIAMHLCLVMAPLCLLAYVFEQTRFMFVTWAKFTVNTLFSMVVITVVTVIALKATIMLGTALLAMDGVSSGLAFASVTTGTLYLRDIATISGGLGMLLTTLILGTPPLMTNFFSGQVGAIFSGYNQVGSVAAGNKPAAGSQDFLRSRNSHENEESAVHKHKAMPELKR